MSETFQPVYQCSACEIAFSGDQENKQHFKSELHRYNLKRKHISLPAITAAQFEQLMTQEAAKSSTQGQYRCDICWKTFMSASTYSQHIASIKHKQREQQRRPKPTLNKSASSASSNFEVLRYENETAHKKEVCMICAVESTDLKRHLQQHNFPPFEQSCSKPQELREFVAGIIGKGECLYCGLAFGTSDGARQHMADVGHGMINTANFRKYEKFYDWRIEEEQEDNGDSEQWEPLEKASVSAGPTSQKPLTLEDIQNQLQKKIVVGTTGAKIGDKQVGMRCFRQYYRQYFREIKWVDRNPCKAIEDKENTTVYSQAVPFRRFERVMTGRKQF